MNLEDLVYFLAIAETGMLHRAAAQVGISQPALTKAVHRLERELRMPLFERSSRGMRMTPYGVAFQRRATGLRVAYEETLSYMGELHAGDLARVRISTSPAAEPIVAQTFLRLMRSRPTLGLEMKVQLSDALMRTLLDGEADIVVSPLPAHIPEDLDVHPIREESTFIICRKDHPLHLTDREVSPGEMLMYRWLLPPKAVLGRQQIDESFLRLGLNEPAVQVESNYASPTGVFDLLANTDMLGICSMHHRLTAEQFGLRVLHTEQLSWRRKLACFVRKGSVLSPLTATFLEALLETSHSLETAS